ncbi:MAG: homoserine O-acetyltransferase [Flavobacteriales bacterium]
MTSYVFKYDSDFYTERGAVIKGLEIAYTTRGSFDKSKSNVVWVIHALTGNADVFDWWAGLFGENDLFNPKDHFIVSANNLGSCYGSTGPLSINPESGQPYYHSFPLITIKDIAKSLQLLADHLGIEKIKVLIGGSMGGQIALEWSLTETQRFENLILIATSAKHSSWGIAFNESQRMAIEADVTWGNQSPLSGVQGLKAARSIALLSYRNHRTYNNTQVEEEKGDLDKINHFKAASYQRYQGEKLVKRFNAYSYYTLLKAMDTHNIGRGREDIVSALNHLNINTLLINIDTDILFPLEDQSYLYKHIPVAWLEQICSLYGHDGFLIETKKLTHIIRRFLPIPLLFCDGPSILSSKNEVR